MLGCETTADSINTETSKNDSKTKTKDDGLPPPPAPIANADIEIYGGEKFKISENNGKVILVNLWAIWCTPCIAEMPHLNELHEKYKDQGLIILGLNTGNDMGGKETEENVKAFVEKQGLKYTIGWSHRPLTEQFMKLGQMNGIPQSFLINRNGKLTGIFQGGGPKVISQMKENVEKVVNEQ